MDELHVDAVGVQHAEMLVAHGGNDARRERRIRRSGDSKRRHRRGARKPEVAVLIRPRTRVAGRRRRHRGGGRKRCACRVRHRRRCVRQRLIRVRDDIIRGTRGERDIRAVGGLCTGHVGRVAACVSRLDDVAGKHGEGAGDVELGGGGDVAEVDFVDGRPYADGDNGHAGGLDGRGEIERGGRGGVLAVCEEDDDAVARGVLDVGKAGRETGVHVGAAEGGRAGGEGSDEVVDGGGGRGEDEGGGGEGDCGELRATSAFGNDDGDVFDKR